MWTFLISLFFDPCTKHRICMRQLHTISHLCLHLHLHLVSFLPHQHFEKKISPLFVCVCKGVLWVWDVRLLRNCAGCELCHIHYLFFIFLYNWVWEAYGWALTHFDGIFLHFVPKYVCASREGLGEEIGFIYPNSFDHLATCENQERLFTIQNIVIHFILCVF